MASRKQSGGALIVGILVLIALVPKEVWITLGVVTLVGGVFYVYSRWQSNKVPAPAADTDHQPTLAELTRTLRVENLCPQQSPRHRPRMVGTWGHAPLSVEQRTAGVRWKGRLSATSLHRLGSWSSQTWRRTQNPAKIELGNLAAAMTAVTERQSQSARADREAMRSIAPARTPWETLPSR